MRTTKLIAGEPARHPIIDVKERLTLMTFGTWLKKHRQEQGLSLRELEKRIDRICTFSYLAQLELAHKGKKGQEYQPAVEIVDALAVALDRPIAEARLAAGYAPKEPESRAERLEQVLRSLGADEFQYVEGIDRIRHMSDEEFDDLLRDIMFVVELRTRRKATS
jgi:transcriptional regulator with XRE-family HTH domain